MKNKGITTKITLTVILIVFLCMSLLTYISYNTIFDSVERSAGIELTGCANITTGLIDPKDIEALLAGETSKSKELGETISWTISKKPIFKNQYILSLDGMVLVPDENLEKQGFKYGDQFYVDEDAIENLLVTRSQAFSHIYKYGGATRITGYAPIYKDHDESKEIIAINAIDFDASIIRERTWDMMWKTVVLGVLLPIIAALLTFIIVRRIIQPFQRITSHVQEVSNGHLDLEPLNIQSKDELEQLASDVNTMTSNLKQMFESVRNNATKVSKVSDDVFESARETGKATDQIMISASQIAEGSAKQVSNINDMNDISSKITNEMSQITEKVHSVQASSSTASTTAVNGNEVIMKAVDQIGSISEQSQNTAQIITTLSHKSKEIEQIVSLISDVSEQTNLLALNASIEAARAGEQGRGFAVVADEVRRLAEQSNEATQQIQELIRDVQGQTDHAVTSMENEKKVIKEGITIMEHAGASFVEITNSIEVITSQIQEVATAIGLINRGIEQMDETSQEIASISGNTSEMTQQMAEITQKQKEAMSTVTSALSKVAKDLEETLTVFKF